LSCDDPFWASHYPPNGWHCGCRVRPVSAGGLARMGKDGPDAAPPIQTRAWRNPHTGAVVQVPVGIDPGFDYNPGLAWKQTRPDDHEPSHLASP
ncbi:phage head morphogenesis protein, partial [Staphylococcus aureus]